MPKSHVVQHVLKEFLHWSVGLRMSRPVDEVSCAACVLRLNALTSIPVTLLVASADVMDACRE